MREGRGGREEEGGRRGEGSKRGERRREGLHSRKMEGEKDQLDMAPTTNPPHALHSPATDQ